MNAIDKRSNLATPEPVSQGLALRRILVVVDEEVLDHVGRHNLNHHHITNMPKLVQRAVELASTADCELELFHACHSAALTPAMFADVGELHNAQHQYVEQKASQLMQLALQINKKGITVRQDTRWDAPSGDAILRKIEASQPDLVLKKSAGYDYIVGLLANADWDLIRNSPAHIWFVNGDTSVNGDTVNGGSGNAERKSDHANDGIEHIVTAIGNQTDDEDIITATDYEVFRMADVIADTFDAENYPVHAYQAPRPFRAHGAYLPELGGSAYAPSGSVSMRELRREAASEHVKLIESFAGYFGVALDNVYVEHGHPSAVLPSVAKTLDADLIVLSARNLSRWQRFVRSVTAEPVLADAPSDVFFVKDNQGGARSDPQNVLSVPVDLTNKTTQAITS